MAVPNRVVLFGDQTVDPYPLIKQLYRRSKNFATLRNFLRQATSALRYELSLIQNRIKDSFPAFDSIMSLAEAYEQDKSNIALSTVLLCIAQIGLLISDEEAEPRVFDASTASNQYLVGFCTGMLPAAAATTARSIGQLLRLAPEIITLSLRLGLEAKRRSDMIELDSDSWAVVVPEISAAEQQQLLDEFHSSHMIPTGKRVYISAEAESTTTVSGPPSTLQTYFASTERLNKARKFKLPISSAFHASHLGEPDAEIIVGQSPLLNEYAVRGGSFFISSSTGLPVKAKTLRELLVCAVHDVLERPLRWSKMVKELVDAAKGTPTNVCTVGPARAADGLCKAFTKASIEVVPNQRPAKDTSSSSFSDIAIIGISGRLPGGETMEEIWETLKAGKDMHREVPGDRFPIETHVDPTGKAKNTIYTPYGCFIERPGFFDARLFNMSPREAAQTDPAQRLLLLTTYEALEMAGYSPYGSPSYYGERIGTFFGQTLDDYRETQACQDVDMYYVTGGIRAFGAGRLNYHFKWEGPSYCLDAACSSSALSIQLGMQSLLSGECDTAVAGGTNVVTGSDMYAGLAKGSFLSRTGSCKTFDDGADGYCRGDGVGTVIMKRMEDAIAEGDNIIAVLKSATTNHSAHAVSITHPHAGAQQSLMREALRQACVEPQDIDYVEMHGTGTQAGDATEFSSVTGVLSKGRTKDSKLHIGAIKANVGHAEAAAGINSLIKVILMMQKSQIPPHVGIKTKLNSKFPPLDSVNVVIDRELSPFVARAGGDGKRRIILNNFNATGGNTSLLLEDPPERILQGVDDRVAHIVAVSGRTATSYTENAKRLLAYLQANPETRLCDLAYTTTARRMHHIFRKSYAGKALQDVVDQLAADVKDATVPAQVGPSPSAVFMFTGQGSQYLGMGRQFYENSKIFRDQALEMDHICVRQGLPSFVDMISGQGPQEFSPTQVQLALVAVQVAMAAMWQSLGIKPKAVIGHSLGEFAALCVAGVVSISDALYLVGRRALCMESTCTAGSHAMLAVQSDAEGVSKILASGDVNGCDIACINGPTSTVVSGTTKDINVLKEIMSKSGVKSKVLDVPFAFHSSQMDPLQEAIKPYYRDVIFSKPKLPVASTLHGALVVDSGVFDATYLARQAREAVKYTEALTALKDAGIADDNTFWVEMGPHPLCQGMVRSTLKVSPKNTLASMRNDEPCGVTITKSLVTAYNAGANLAWSEFHNEYRKSLNLLPLPTYAFDLKNYWIQYSGDWKLTKNTQKAIAPAPAIAASAAVSDFSTTCLQQVIAQDVQKDGAAIKFSSKLSQPKLNAAIRGHLVEGVGLCPSSVYSAIAFDAATYVNSSTSQSKDAPAMDLHTMEIFNPLVVNTADTAQTITVTADKKPADDSVKITISSTADGKSFKEHCRCVVTFGNGQQWRDEWKKNAYLVQSRMDTVDSSVVAGKAHKILNNMIYKLFCAVVKYSKEYHTCDYINMDAELNEATTAMKLSNGDSSSGFLFSPFWLDTLAHFPGFVLNGNVHCPEELVYISHGWDSMRISGAVDGSKTYRGYVRMQKSSHKGVLAGDVFVFDGDEVVIFCAGVKFQEMKRTTLRMLLGVNNTAATPAAAPRKAVAPAPVAAAKTKKVVVEEVAAPIASTGFDDILATIAEEVGVEVNEFKDNTNIVDMGVDSLLTISILGKLRPQTGLDLPASVFNNNPTVGQLKAYLAPMLAASQPTKTVTKTKKVEKAASAPATAAPAAGVFDDILATIAEEVGVEVSEFKDNTNIVDMGVDSLLTISILGKLRPQTGLELPASIFNNHPTVAQLKAYFAAELGAAPAAAVVDDSTDSESSDAADDEATPPSSVSDGPTASGESDKAEILSNIVAREVGIDAREIFPSTNYADIGVDSLLTISILGAFKEETGEVLDAHFLQDHPTPADVAKAFGITYAAPPAPKAKKEFAVVKKASKTAASSSSELSCVVLMLQGDKKQNKSSPLFLLPDGSGSLFSYIHVPALPSKLPVYGIDSPFHKDPSKYTISFEEVASIYIREIRKIQPHGPYKIGGWSLGGIHSYEVCRQLICAGEEIEHLIMIDSPCPGTLPPLPSPSLDLLEKAGIFQGLGNSSGGVSGHTRGHFLKCVYALEHWKHRNLTPEEAKKIHKVTVIWAREGVLEHDDEARKGWNPVGNDSKGLDADMEKAKEWLTGKRYAFGPEGWDVMTGKTPECMNAAGNHFSIMFPPNVQELGDHLARVL